MTTAPLSHFGFAVAVHPHEPDTAWFVPAHSDQKRAPIDGRVIVTRSMAMDPLWEGLPVVKLPSWDALSREAVLEGVRALSTPEALAAYAKLTDIGVRLVQRGGLLVQCSCSSRVTAEQFYATVNRAASRIDRPLDELRRTGHAAEARLIAAEVMTRG